MRICHKIDSILLQKKSSFRKGDIGIGVVLAAALGALVLIGFYMVAKNGIGTWGESFQRLVSL